MKLSALLSDGLVLQRDRENTIWGSGCSGHVAVRVFEGVNVVSEAEQEAAADGSFEVRLPMIPAGGPYEMEISDRNDHCVIRDILVGDVFLLSGQSNMELPVRRTLDENEEYCKSIDKPEIRQFEVPKEYDFHAPVPELSAGVWKSAVQENIYDFSAFGFFFAELWQKKEQVPVGLLQTALGGIQIEALIPEDKLRTEGGKLAKEAEKRGERREKDGVFTSNHYDKFYYDEIIRLDKDDAYIENILQQEEERNNAFYAWLDREDRGLRDSWKERESLFDPDESPEYLEIPGRWEKLPGHGSLEKLRGTVWVLKRFEAPDECIGKEAKLCLGTVVDADETYLNGTLIGKTEYRYPPRRYRVPPGILRKDNVLTVRVKALQRAGGFVEEMPYMLLSGTHVIPLSGKYEFKTGVDLYRGGVKAFPGIEEPDNTFFQYRPCGIYNKMIYPLRRWSLCGMLFYQGESNTRFYREYESLLRLFLTSIRETFRDPKLKTGIVMLPYFGEEDDERGSGNWDKLRTAQKKAGDIENTVLIDLYDLGQRFELHPQNKRQAAERAFIQMQTLYR